MSAQEGAHSKLDLDPGVIAACRQAARRIADLFLQDAARLRPLIAGDAALPERRGVLVQLGAKWNALGVAGAALARLMASLSERGALFRPGMEPEHHIGRRNGSRLDVVFAGAASQHRGRKRHPEVAILDHFIDFAHRGRRIGKRQFG